MDAGGAEEFLHHLVPGPVAVAQVHGQFEQYLPGHHLVTMHVTDILELRLHYKQKMLNIHFLTPVETVSRFWFSQSTRISDINLGFNQVIHADHSDAESTCTKVSNWGELLANIYV